MAQGDFWTKLKQRLRDVSTAAADFTEEQALIGKLKFDILSLKRKIDRKQREIGLRVCELADEKPHPDVFKDFEISSRILEIADLGVQVEQKKSEITKVANQVRSKRAEADDPDIEEIVKQPAPKPKKPAAKRTTTKTPAKTGTTKKKPAARKTPAKPKTEVKETEDKAENKE